MCEVKTVKSRIIFPVIEELMDQEKRVRITVTGLSMYPFLRDKKDSVELERSNYQKIRNGDIILLYDDAGYVLHRVIRKNKHRFYMIGDAQQWMEGPFHPDQIIAVAVAIWRRNRRIPCSDARWRILSFFWRLLRPFRYLIIRTYRWIRELLSPKGTGRGMP